MPPELREDRGEIEAAREGRLPRLIEEADLRGDCHAHSDWSDGIHSVERMAEAARARGYAYLVLTDHSHGLPIAHGLDPERVRAQRAVVRGLNRRFAAEEEAGTAPSATPPEGFRILHGCELEIRGDGALDFDPELLASFDLVVAALHQGRRQSRAQLTDRVLGAIRSPHVDVIAHPAGRMLGEHARDDLDLAWDEVFAAAAETGTLLEIDGSDHRLDLAPERARRAVAAGCRLTIDSDAHRTDELRGDPLGRGAGAPGVGRAVRRRQHLVTGGASRMGGREAGTRPMSGKRTLPGRLSSFRALLERLRLPRRRPPLAVGRPGVPVAPPSREGRTRDRNAGGRPSGPGVVGRALPQGRVRHGLGGR